MNHTDRVPIRRKCISRLPECFREQCHQLVDRCAAGDTGIYYFRETQETAWTQYTSALAKKQRPDFALENYREKSGVDQIESCIRKLQWIGNIHHPKGCVRQLLRTCSRVGIIDHQAADIDAFHVGVRTGKGNIKYPSAGATTEIEYVLKGCRISNPRK